MKYEKRKIKADKPIKDTHTQSQLSVSEKKETKAPKLDEVYNDLKNSLSTDDQDILTLALNEIINIVPKKNRENLVYQNAVIAMVHELNPTDCYERMLIVQIVSCHIMIMHFSWGAMSYEHEDIIDIHVNRAAKLMRAFKNHSEALQKYRGKGSQTIQVQHINLQDHAQAILGNVRGGK